MQPTGDASQPQLGTPYAAPKAALRDATDDEPLARRRMLIWGGVAIALLGLLAVMAYWFIGQFEQIFRSFGADVSAPTLAVLRGRFGWFALPVLAGLLTAAGWWRWRPALTPGRVIGTLIGLLVAAAILACLCWYALYLPIFKLGEQV